jgi:hypothetical protein
MEDLLLGYAKSLLEYQVLLSACLIVFACYAIGRDINRSLGRIEDQLSKIFNSLRQSQRDV